MIPGRQSLLELLAALEAADKLGEVDAIHIGNAAYLTMDYMGRFSVELNYDADFAYKRGRWTPFWPAARFRKI